MIQDRKAVHKQSLKEAKAQGHAPSVRMDKSAKVRAPLLTWRWTSTFSLGMGTIGAVLISGEEADISQYLRLQAA
jgi:hypothetical protein